MIKTLNRTLKQDRERFTLPKNVQDIIPVQSVYPDGKEQIQQDVQIRGHQLLCSVCRRQKGDVPRIFGDTQCTRQYRSNKAHYQ